MDRRRFLLLMGAGGAAAAGAGAGIYTWRRNNSTPPLRSTSRNPDHPRLVLFYVPCTVPAWAINPFNPSITFTPNLARLAEQSAVLSNNSVEVGHSGLSYASLFTGAHADRHGIFTQPEVLSAPLPQISQVFADNGYDTFYFNHHPMAKFNMKYGLGSRHVDDYLLTPRHWLFDRLLDKLSSDKNYRAFVMTTFTVTHAPYAFQPTLRQRIQDYGLSDIWAVRDLPAERKTTGLTWNEVKNIQDRYQNGEPSSLHMQWDFPNYVKKLGYPPDKLKEYLNAIRYLFQLNMARLDTLFGKTVDRIRERGLMKQSVIAFTADHGEIMHRDNALFHFTHGNQLAPEVLNTPLIIYGPSVGVKPGMHNFVSRSTDVFPTLAGLCSQAMPQGAAPAGADLSATLRGADPAPQLDAFSHETVMTPENAETIKKYPTLMKVHPPLGDPASMWAAVRNGNHVVKYEKTGIEDSAPRLVAFHTPSDPQERNDMYDPADPNLAAMAERLQQYKQRLSTAYSEWRSKRPETLSDQQKTKKLKDMGYIE